MSDLAELKPADEVSRQVEERFRRLVDVMPVAVYVCDTSGAIQNYNNRAVELWGREPPLGAPAERYCGSLRLYAPDGTLVLHQDSKMAEVLRTGIEARDLEVVIERPDASRITVLVNIVPLRNGDGELIGAMNCSQDITDRKRAEEGLRQSERLLRLVLDALPVGVAVVDLSGNIILSNPGVRKTIQNSAVPIRDTNERVTGAVVVNEDISAPMMHARSTTAHIRLRRDAQALVLEIEDQGVGIPNAALTHIMSGGAGVGVAGMRERIDQLGGHLEITSDDHGTTVRARLPLVKDAG
jgi:PAS domain-containing protein